MAIRSGLGLQLGFAAEATYGTYVVPTRFLEVRSEGLTFNRETIQSEGIRKGSTVRRTGRWAVNKKGGGGQLTMELANKGFGLLLKHALGAVAITTPPGATLARQHRHTLGHLDDLSLTAQKAFPDTATGTDRPFTFLGCVITEWELSVDVDGLLMFNPTLDAQDMVTTEAVAAPSYPASDELFSYQQVSLTVDGGAETPTAFSLTCSHGLKTDRYFVRASPLKKRPLIAAHRELSGSMTFEFESMTQVNRFLNAAPGAEIPASFAATGDEIESGHSYALNGSLPAIVFDGEMPTVQGPDVITLTAPFRVLDNTVDQPITLDYITTDTAS